MKRILCLLFVVQLGFTMDQSERIVGRQLSAMDKEQMIDIHYPTDVHQNEIVAVNAQGAWLYARVQSPPTFSSGSLLGILNWAYADPTETFRGQVRNFEHAVKKLPSLEKKVQKTQ